MLRKASFWVPLGIAVGLAAWLWFRIDDPLGKSFATYVQAVTTLLLVAVTTTYVVLTGEIAAATKAQLTYSKAQREIDAVTQLWEAFAALPAVAHQVAGDIRRLKATIDHAPTDYYLLEKSRSARVLQLSSFRTEIARNMIHVSDDVKEQALKVAQDYDWLAGLAHILDEQVSGEFARSTKGDGTGFDATDFKKRWNDLQEYVYLDFDFPDWHGLGEASLGNTAKASGEEFQKLVKTKIVASRA